jgi:CO/xanthine dehydrogenase FAD-binding subunit
MNNIKWYYPVSLAEVSLLLEKKGLVLHGGGTNLTSRNISGIEGFICLKNLDLDYVKNDKNMIEIGAMCSYADIVKKLREISPDNILVKSLQHAANTPCRNRITLGGSVAYVPKWSDLAGALLALDADLVLSGKQNGEFKFSEYLEQKELRKQTMVCAVRIKDKPHLSAHYREIKTANDMPLFTITVLLNVKNEKISPSRIFVVGTKERMTELGEVENYLSGKNIKDLHDTDIQDLVNVEFLGKRITDPGYMSYKVKVETARTIRKALEAA